MKKVTKIIQLNLSKPLYEIVAFVFVPLLLLFIFVDFTFQVIMLDFCWFGIRQGNIEVQNKRLV